MHSICHSMLHTHWFSAGSLPECTSDLSCTPAILTSVQLKICQLDNQFICVFYTYGPDDGVTLWESQNLSEFVGEQLTLPLKN